MKPSKWVEPCILLIKTLYKHSNRINEFPLEGYTEYEKVRLAENYLVPRQIEARGMSSDEIVFSEDALRKIIRNYTREAGVRNLRRQIGTVCRKVSV
ncbi:hypothetical protein ACFL0H_09055 [Thermodesulfobacteriota bacterium]